MVEGRLVVVVQWVAVIQLEFRLGPWKRDEFRPLGLLVQRLRAGRTHRHLKLMLQLVALMEVAEE